MGKKKGKGKVNQQPMPDARDDEMARMETKWQPEPTGESPPPTSKPRSGFELNGATFGLPSPTHGLLSLAPIAELQTAQDSPNIQIHFLTKIHDTTTTNPQILHSFLQKPSPMVPRVTWRGLEGVHQ